MTVDARVLDAARSVGDAAGVPPAALLAVALVETNAVAFAHFADRAEPLIRFEGHWFDRLLSPPDRDRARAESLADPRAGRVRNPVSQAGRWRLFDRAATIDAEAAAGAVSWGLCQVMGMHAKALGYASAGDAASASRASAEGQFELAARFLRHQGLADRLAAGDVAGFARGYNGPLYRRNRYDEKIAVALTTAQRLIGGEAPAGTPRILRLGMRGPDVRRLQRALRAAGATLASDGIFGPQTQAALLAFQSRLGLAASGAADAATWGKLT